MSDEIKDIFQRAKQLHYELKIPTAQLDRYLSWLRSQADKKSKIMPCGCLGRNEEVSPYLARAIKATSDKQKADLYLKTVLIAVKLLENNQTQQRMKGEIKPVTWHFFNQSEKQWERKLIEIDDRRLTIKFKATKQEIDLHNYILRASKKKDREGQALALESTACQLPQTIRVSNFQQSFLQFKNILESLINQGIKENLLKMANIEASQDNKAPLRLSKKGKEQQKSELIKKNSVIIIQLPSQQQFDKSKTSDVKLLDIQTRSNYSKQSFHQSPHFRITKELDQSQNLKNKAKIISISTLHQKFQDYRPNVFINIKENRVRKLYRFTNQPFHWKFQYICDNLMANRCFKRWKKSLKHSKVLSQSQSNQIKIFTEEHHFKNGCQVSYIYQRQQVLNGQNSIYFIDTPIQTGKDRATSLVEYCLWKFQKSTQSIQIMSEAKIYYANVPEGIASIQLTDEFLGQMNYICENINIAFSNQTDLSINSLIFEEQLSQIEPFHSNPSEYSDFYSINEVEENNIPTVKDITISKVTEIEKLFVLNQNGISRLTFKHPQFSLPKGKSNLRYPIKSGEHPYFENEFSFSKQGEMISVNQKKLKAQSSVLKDVIKTIGKHFFSGKSILSISLPVTVFSVESNLSLLCKSYAYAPKLLERAAREQDPVHRLKFIAVFTISAVIAYLQMDKPFNPILGQTFQAFFDGCMVYGEQVSHHPPISSTFMKGRGYALYGSFEAKVNMGLNSATGSNEGILHICFDQDNLRNKLVKVVAPPGQVTGLTFGVRKVAATQKSYILDIQNRLYLQLTFNQHKGKTQFSKFYDGVEGKIVKLSPHADISNISRINKKSIVKQYGTICGRWTKQIYYDDQLIFDSWVDMACAYQKYPHPLESDAYYREDLILRVAYDYESSQTAKEKLEEIQRHDRRLRKEYSQNKYS